MAITAVNTSSVTASIATGVATSSSTLRSPNWKHIVPVLALAFPLWFAGLWRRSRARWIAFLAVFAILLVGCGVSASSGGGGGGGGGVGGGGTQNQTPAGTYAITVTGTMSNITHTAQITLTVQ
jgi:hypothetical protein